MDFSGNRENAIFSALSAHIAGGGKAIGYAGDPFPAELALALDLLPLPLLALGPCRDEAIEADWIDDKEDADVRSVFIRAMRGDLSRLSAIISLRAMDHVHYYLREVTRRGAWNDAVPLHICDIMPLRGEGIGRYNRKTMRRLAGFLEQVAGKPLDEGALARAVAQGNAERARLRDIDALRRKRTLTGSVAFDAMLGGQRPTGNGDAAGARILLVSSAPLANAALHRLMEEAGGNIVAEEDGSGRFTSGDDLVFADEPLNAIADYYATLPTALAHPREDRTAFIVRRMAEGGIDGVLFHMHRGDLRLGWDYPVLRDRIEGMGVPVVMVRADAGSEEGRDAIRDAARALITRTGG